MTTITFKNGETLEAQSVWGRKDVFQNANRDTLEIRIPATEDIFEKLKAIYTNSDARSEISVEEKDENGTVTASSFHTNFTLGMELGLKSINDAKMWTMKIARKSEIEIMQEQQAIEIEKLKALITAST